MYSRLVCRKTIQCLKKLWVLPTSIILVAPILFFKEMYSVYYIAPISFIISLFTMYLFPSLSVSLFSRPLYYEDLMDKFADGNKNRKYQIYFRLINSLYSAILASAIIDYVVFKFDQTGLSYFEILGVIGGVLGVFKKWQLLIGKYIMLGLFQCKNLNQIKRQLNRAKARLSKIKIVNESNESKSPRKNFDADNLNRNSIDTISQVGIELADILPDV